jgi:DNA-binding response OmpR family regulator
MEVLLYATHIDESSVLAFLLQQTGITVRTSQHLEHSIENWPEHPSDIILLAFSGSDYAKAVQHIEQIRASSIVPIIIISDPIPEDQVVVYYTSGADLVLTRPFSARLLQYIVRAQLRRSNTISFYSLPTLTQSGLALDPTTRMVSIENGKPRHLTQLEFRLLYTLMVHAGQVIPSEKIIEHVWGYSGEGGRDLVRGLVQRLRSKVEENPQKPRYIHTEPGIGYYFRYVE